jgi:protein phosphatase
MARQQPPGTHPIVAGAASNAGRDRGPRGGSPAQGGPGTAGGPGAPRGAGGPGGPGPGGLTMADDTPAQRAAALRDTMPQPPIAVEDAPSPMPAPGQSRERAAAQPQVVRSRRGWTWLVVALVVFVVLVGGGGYVGWRYLQSGYYVGADNGNVAIFQGSPDGVFGIGSSKVKERPNPPIALADLPKAEQDSVRQNIEGLDSIDKAHATVASLRQEMCRYSIGANGSQVVIFKGKDQAKCVDGSTPPIIPGTPKLEVKALPGADQNAVKKTIAVANRQEADTRLAALASAAKQCQADENARPDCPRKKSS